LDKAADAFRTISEVADDLDVPQHVLRFWESRFNQIRPMKRAGGRRYYRADDIDLLRGIRQLLYGEGYTIRGVQRILKEHGAKFVQTVWQEGAPQPTRMPDDGAADGAELPPEEIARAPRGEKSGRREPRFNGPDGGEQSANAPAAKLDADGLRRLQAVLHELSECRRLLDSALR
jgi:DNA-binding transcriptional MerR regulator